MSRLPFDAGRAEGAEPVEDRPASGAGEGSEPLSVSRLSELITATLERRIPAPVRVIGEVSNLSARNHWYFSLKDEKAVIGCVAWASTACRFGFRPGDGDEIIATGHVSHYGPQGRTQLYVSAIKPVGAGELELRFRALCDELRRLGYFQPERKRPLPTFPRRIAVVTSAGGAALQDVIATAAQRCPAVALLLVDVRVQGEGSADEVARAIEWIDRHRRRLEVDAILVTRGGGSIEDLWSFNERIVADAVHAAHLPVVAAIGHESDTTVAELVADVRAATPTQAAMLLVPDAADLRRQVDHLDHRLRVLMARRLERARQRLDLIARIELFARPGAVVARAAERVEHLRVHLSRSMRHALAERRVRLEALAARWGAMPVPAIVGERQRRIAVLADRLDRGIRRRIDQGDRLTRLRRDLDRAAAGRIERGRARIDALGRRLDAIDPRRVLGRGFTYTTGPSGALIRSVGDVGAGAAIETHVADGAIRSVVGGAARRRPARPGDDEADQMDLFDRPSSDGPP